MHKTTRGLNNERVAGDAQALDGRKINQPDEGG
jgi:hypothetical protein